MEVALAGAHATHVETQHGLHGVQGLGQVVVDIHQAQGGDLEAGFGIPQLVGIHLLAVGRIVQRQPAVGDLRRLGDVFRSLGANEDGDIGAQRVGDGLDGFAQAPGTRAVVGQGIEFTVAGHRLFPGQYLADDVDILPGAGQGFAVGLAVPAFHHLGAGYPQAEDHAPAGQVIQGDGRHGAGRRGAGRQLGHGSAEANLRGVGTYPGQGRKAIVAVGLRGPHRVVAQALRLLRHFDMIGGRLRAPVPQLQAQRKFCHDVSPCVEALLYVISGGRQRRAPTARAD